MNLNNASIPKQPPEDANRAFVESSSDSIYLVDEECRYVFGNSEYLSRLGLSLKEIIDRSYGEFHSTEDTEDFTNTIRRVLTTGTSVQHEYKSLRDNRFCNILSQVCPSFTCPIS